LECNYCCGGKVKQVMERFDLEKRRYLTETEQVLDPKSSLYLNWPRAL
jgi:hypothetical protein